MKNGTILLLLVILGGIWHCAYAQTPEPSPAEKRLPVGPALNQNESPPTGNQKEIEDTDVVRIDTTLVNVPVQVVDRDGKLIPRLGRQDFRIFEDGEERAIASFNPVESRFTVVLLLDVSQSTKSRLKAIQRAAIAFIDQLRAEDRVYVIAFSCFTQLMADGSNNRNSIREAIRRTYTGRGTCLYSSVNFTINEVLKQISGRKALVIFSDGVDDPQPPLDAISGVQDATYESTVYDAEELDALIYPIQYNTTADLIRELPGKLHDQIYRNAEVAKAYLHDLAQKTGGRVYQADNIETLNQSFAFVAEELRNQYSLSFYPRPSGQPGQRHSIKVRVSRSDAVVRARSNYLGPTLSQATGRSLMPTTTAWPRPGIILLHYDVSAFNINIIGERIIGGHQALAIVKNVSEKTVQTIGWEISIINQTDKRVLKTLSFNTKLQILPDEAKRLRSDFNYRRDKITYRIQLVEIKYSDGSVWKRS